MTEAKERGYTVNDDLFDKCLDYLEKKVGEDTSDFYEARTQSYAIYLLTRNGRVTTNYIEHVRGWLDKNATLTDDPDYWKQDIACAYLACSYAMLKNQDEADKLINNFHLVGPQMEYTYDLYNALGRDGIYLDLMSHHFPKKLKELSPDDLQAIVKPIMDGDYTTLSAAEAILGLDSYARAVGMAKAVADLKISQKVGDTITELKLEGNNYPRGSFDGDATSILFYKPTENEVGLSGLFYQVCQTGFDDQKVTTPLSEGIEISREYDDADNKPVTTVGLGGELTVVIKVRADGNKDIPNIVVQDLLPGGFEVESESVHSGYYTGNDFDYADVREDRVDLFGTAHGDETTFTYKIKATNKGTFVIPPVQVESMYNRKISARTVSGTMTVN
jgi:uncharacterized repeat protein (TIGR01451 family)